MSRDGGPGSIRFRRPSCSPPSAASSACAFSFSWRTERCPWRPRKESRRPWRTPRGRRGFLGSWRHLSFDRRRPRADVREFWQVERTGMEAPISKTSASGGKPAGGGSMGGPSAGQNTAECMPPKSYAKPWHGIPRKSVPEFRVRFAPHARTSIPSRFCALSDSPIGLPSGAAARPAVSGGVATPTRHLCRTMLQSH